MIHANVSEPIRHMDRSPGNRNDRLEQRRSTATPVRNHRHGSAIILVVVTLVLMTILGTAYIQTARVGRRTSSTTRQSIEIDSVAEAVILQISNVLRDDLLDDNGNFFNPDSPDQGGTDEPYDYPWTNTTVNAMPLSTDVNGNPFSSAPTGGQYDDTWLASTTPDFEIPGPDPAWPHITNLNGVFLRLPLSTGSQPLPEENPVNYTTTPKPGYLSTDKDVKITIVPPFPVPPPPDTSMSAPPTTNWQSWGVDADGDGIPDSRWTWAPIRQIGEVSYVMAVRIIDNSSQINVNVATATTDDGTNFQSITGDHNRSIRGYYPTDADLSRLLSRTTISIPWSTGKNDLRSIFTNIRGFTIASVDPFPVRLNLEIDLDDIDTDLMGRENAWFKNIVYYGNRTNKLNISNELELRYRGGLNHPDIAYAMDTEMKGLLRDSPGSSKELSYQNVLYDTNTISGADQMLAYFQGTDPNDTTPQSPVVPVKDRVFPAIRHMLTTINGSALFASNHSNIHAGDHKLKYDLVFRDRDKTTDNYYQDNDISLITGIPDRVERIANRLKKILNIGSPTYLNESANNIDVIATEFALAIQDYSDTDHVPTKITQSGITYYGLETLPFIREVYVQFGYEDQDIVPPAGDNVHDTWVRIGGSQAMAIEIGNPFDRPIKFDDISVRVKVGTVIFVLNDPSAVANGFPSSEPELEPRGSDQSWAIIYSNPINSVDEGGKGNDLAADLGFDSRQRIRAADGTFTFNLPFDGNSVTVEMQVEVGSGNWVTYDRFALDLLNNLGNDSEISHLLPASPSIPKNRHVQASVARDGNGMRFVSNTGKAQTASPRVQPDGSVNPDTLPEDQYDTSIDQLTHDEKGIAGDNSLDNYQLPVANRRFMSVAELGWIHMFGFTDEIDGDFPNRLDSLDPARRNLHFRRTVPGSTVSGVAVPDSTGIPHAAMVMDEFTTLSTRHDGIDNDDDDGDNDSSTGVDNSAEQFAPGVLNINTVPLHIATLATPLAESIDDVEALMEAIAIFRDEPAKRSSFSGLSGYRSQPGILGIGELLWVNPHSNGVSGAQAANDMQRYLVANKGTNLDLYPLPENLSSNGGKAEPLSVPGSAEEQMARFQFLSQVFTTRSDIFTAYVVVQGFPSDDFRKGPVESTRFYAVFDRSGITGTNDAVRVVGVYKY